MKVEGLLFVRYVHLQFKVRSSWFWVALRTACVKDYMWVLTLRTLILQIRSTRTRICVAINRRIFPRVAEILHATSHGHIVQRPFGAGRIVIDVPCDVAAKGVGHMGHIGHMGRSPMGQRDTLAVLRRSRPLRPQNSSERSERNPKLWHSHTPPGSALHLIADALAFRGEA